MESDTGFSSGFIDDDLKAIEASSRRYQSQSDLDSVVPERRTNDFDRRKRGSNPNYLGSSPGQYGSYGHSYPPQPHVLGDLSSVQTAHLSEEERKALLDELLVGHNSHTEERRRLTIEEDKLNLDNKKRFSNLGHAFAKWGGLLLGASILILLGFTGYAVIFDKQIIDGNIIGAFLRTFSEIVKTIFMAF